MTTTSEDLNNKDKIFNIILHEAQRQRDHIELIASENYVSKDVLEAQWSILTNKYAEWYPLKRYYWGCEYIDQVESLAIELAKQVFSTDYSVNVQPHSGSSANMWVYLSVLRPWDTILWMSLDAGWHLTHWAVPSFSGSKYGLFNSVSYWLWEDWLLDYNQVEKLALEHKPKIIVAWASAYSRVLDFHKFREIADLVWAYLLVDIAHIAWLIATWHHPSPFWLADFVTTTTHKTLRWPRGWVIFTKDKELAKKVNSAIFPWIQWGPLEHVIAAKAVCFAEALTDKYKEYIWRVVENAKTFENYITVFDYNWKKIRLVWHQTDNHLLLLDFTELELSGKVVEKELSLIWITVNKNSVPWDKDPTNPSGIRIWTPAITSRWVTRHDIIKIVRHLLRSVENCLLYRDWKISEDEYYNVINQLRVDNLQIVSPLSIYS